MTFYHILYSIAIAVMTISGLIIGYFGLANHLRRTIKYQNNLIDKMAEHERKMLDKVRKYEYNHNVSILE